MNKTILVVDDDIGLRNAISLALRKNNFTVVTAENGIDGLGKLYQMKPSLIISDLKMPELDGLEFLKRAREKLPNTPMMMMTAYGKVDEAVEAMKAGAIEFITKPFEIGLLETLVEKAISSSPSKEEKSNIPSVNVEFIASDVKTTHVFQLANTVAKSRASILISGESGTGKEILAKYIHAQGRAKTGKFVAINCAALPENLLESELFGHEKGAFSGAINTRQGKFEFAHNGTIFLDEIGEMSFALQAKLLRVLQEFEIDRIGGNKPISIDTRVIAATNRDLQKMVAEGKFREDLFYRLNVFPLRLSPLRERKCEIPELCKLFIHKFAFSNEKEVESLSEAAEAKLINYNWPGNIRELSNVIERAVLICKSSEIQENEIWIETDQMFTETFMHASENTETEPNFEESVFEQEQINDVSQSPNLGFSIGGTIREMEQKMILYALKEHKGNRTIAAKSLGLSLRTLRNKINEYRAEGVYIAAAGSEE